MDHETYLDYLRNTIQFFQAYQEHLIHRIEALYDGARAETAFYAAEISEVELQNVKQVLEKLDVLHEECTTNLSSPEMKDLTKLASFLERAEYALSMEAHNTELAAIAIPVPIHQKQHAISSELLEKLRSLKNSNSLYNDYSQNTKTWHQPLHDDGIDYITLRLIPWLLKSSNESEQALGQKELGALLAHRSERMEKPALTVTKISQRDDLRHFPASFQPAFTALKKSETPLDIQAIQNAIKTIALKKERQNTLIAMH